MLKILEARVESFLTESSDLESPVNEPRKPSNRFLHPQEYQQKFVPALTAELHESLITSLASIPDIVVSVKIRQCEGSLAGGPYAFSDTGISVKRARMLDQKHLDSVSIVECVADLEIPAAGFEENAASLSSDLLCILRSSEKSDDDDRLEAFVITRGRIGSSIRLQVSESNLQALFTASSSDGVVSARLKPVTSLASIQREFAAVSRIESVPLRQEVLLGIAHSKAKAQTITVSRELVSMICKALNPSQYRAVEHALGIGARGIPRIALIQGPPGTGKTHTISALLNVMHVVFYQEYYSSVCKHVKDSWIAEVQTKGGTSSSIPFEVECSHLALMKPRIVVCAPSNVAIDNLVLRSLDGEFSDGEGRKYRPSVIRVGKGSTANESVASCSLTRKVDRILGLSLDEVAEKSRNLEASMTKHRETVVVSRAKLRTLMEGTPYRFRRGYETRVTESPTGAMIPYWVDHVGKSSSYTCPPEFDATRGESVGFTLEEMPEWQTFTRELVSAIDAWEKSFWKFQKYKVVQTHILANARFSTKGDLAALKLTASACPNRLQIVQAVETLILNESSIVFSTLNSAGLPQMQQCNPFRVCIVDEATQCTEPSALIPLSLGVTQLIMVGDPQQLAPTVLSSSKSDGLARSYDLSRSMFERLQSCGVPVVLLAEQYRMVPELSRFPRTVFYSSNLKDSDHVTRLPVPFHCLAPFSLSHVTFVDVTCGKEKKVGSSRVNAQEAMVVADLLHTLLAMGEYFGIRLDSLSIGILSPYAEQVKLISDRLARWGGSRWSKLSPSVIEIATIDSFQGKEKDFVILSTVRASSSEEKSEARGSIGFLNDMRRVNVAITRAKFGLFVVGNASALTSNSIWRQFIKHTRDTPGAYVPYSDPKVDFMDLLNSRFRYAVERHEINQLEHALSHGVPFKTYVERGRTPDRTELGLSTSLSIGAHSGTVQRQLGIPAQKGRSRDSPDALPSSGSVEPLSPRVSKSRVKQAQGLAHHESEVEAADPEVVTGLSNSLISERFRGATESYPSVAQAGQSWEYQGGGQYLGGRSSYLLTGGPFTTSAYSAYPGASKHPVVPEQGFPSQEFVEQEYIQQMPPQNPYFQSQPYPTSIMYANQQYPSQSSLSAYGLNGDGGYTSEPSYMGTHGELFTEDFGPTLIANGHSSHDNMVSQDALQSRGSLHESQPRSRHHGKGNRHHHPKRSENLRGRDHARSFR